MKNIKLKVYNEEACHVLYDLYSDDEYRGQIEVQFGDGKFNGMILFTDKDSEDENGEFEWQTIKSDEILYSEILNILQISA